MPKYSTAVVVEVSRDGYSIGQVFKDAMTVGELKEVLSYYDEDLPVVLSHDNGYTYGTLVIGCSDEREFDEEDQEMTLKELEAKYGCKVKVVK